MEIICEGYTFEFDQYFTSKVVRIRIGDDIRATIQFEQLKRVIELLEVIEKQDG